MMLDPVCTTAAAPKSIPYSRAPQRKAVTIGEIAARTCGGRGRFFAESSSPPKGSVCRADTSSSGAYGSPVLSVATGTRAADDGGGAEVDLSLEWVLIE